MERGWHSWGFEGGFFCRMKERASQIDLLKVKVLVTKSCRLFATPWTVARQVPLSVGCSRQQYWSGLSCSPPGDLPNPGIQLRSPHYRQILHCLSQQGRL